MISERYNYRYHDRFNYCDYCIPIACELETVLVRTDRQMRKEKKKKGVHINFKCSSSPLSDPANSRYILVYHI